MAEFEASIKASRLKHAVSVLHRVNDESIFKVCNDEITSRVVDVANAVMVQVTIAYGDVDCIIAPEAHNVGIDLDKMISILTRASAMEFINISEFADDTWFFEHGIHRRSMGLLSPEKLRKIPYKPCFAYPTAIVVSGREFKDIMASAGDMGVNWIKFYATASGDMVFKTESNDMTPDTYTATLPADRFKLNQPSEEVVKSLYTLEFFQDVAADLRANDEIMIQFATDLPCEIEYERDGVNVKFIVAPRIESD